MAISLHIVKKCQYKKETKETERKTNLSSGITPFWPAERRAFVRPFAQYADLVLILATKQQGLLEKQSAANMTITYLKYKLLGATL